MLDLYKIFNNYRVKQRTKKKLTTTTDRKGQSQEPSSSEIPDLFFDQVLVEYKLSRIEIMVLMYLYRQVWCRPNIYKEYGISQLLSLPKMAVYLNLPVSDVHNALQTIEKHDFISTIRVGQYFVRRYFSKKNDHYYAQTYDSFED